MVTARCAKPIPHQGIAKQWPFKRAACAARVPMAFRITEFAVTVCALRAGFAVKEPIIGVSRREGRKMLGGWIFC